MAAVTTFSIPNSLAMAVIRGFDLHGSDPAWLRTATRSVLVDAITTGIEVPDNEPAFNEDAKVKINVSLPEPAGAMATQRAKECGLSLGPYCKRLLAAVAARSVISPTDSGSNIQPEGLLGEVLSKMRAVDPAIQYRETQREFSNQLRNSLQNGLIGLCEAGTGTGKTMAIAAACAEAALENSCRAVIAAPTVALIRQFAGTYKKMTAFAALPRLRVIFGRREFVSPTEVMAVVNAGIGNFEPDKVIAWVESGGLPPNKEDGIDTPWLASALAQIAPKFPVAEALLPELVETDDAGFEAYSRQFQYQRDSMAEVMLCTHAMLAMDCRSRGRLAYANEQFIDLEKSISAALKLLKPLKGGDKEAARTEIIEMTAMRGKLYADISEDGGLLPGFQFLCVDEAHMLESNFSNALSEYVSMRTLLRNGRQFKALGGKITNKQLEQIADTVDAMQRRSEEIDDDTIMLTQQTSTVNAFRSKLSIIADILFDLPNPGKKNSNELLATHIKLKKMAATIRSASSESHKGQAYLRFSPIRAFPQLFVGRSSVQSILQRMWEGVEGGVAASATLYLRKGTGFSASYQRILLGVPEHRTKEFTPVFPDFLLKPVQGVWLPGKDVDEVAPNRIWLRPPTRSDGLSATEKVKAEQAWIEELAPVVNHIVDTAAGGTLILMTSYASVTALAAAIRSSPYLVVAHPDQPLAKQTERFLRLANEGHKPVWIATGGAWTGLDIGGHDPYARLFGQQIPAGQDNILTDLIIPRIPFGANQSITHAYRLRNNPGIPWEMLEATFRCKQGIGRLVRREGLPANRRIWLLDGRLNDPGMSNYTQGIRNIISCYSQFDLVRQASN